MGCESSHTSSFLEPSSHENNPWRPHAPSHRHSQFLSRFSGVSGVSSSYLRQETWRPLEGGSTLSVWYMWGSTIGKGCGSGIIPAWALHLAWPGYRLVTWPLNFSVLIFKQGNTAPIHQSCYVAGVPPPRWCPVVCV